MYKNETCGKGKSYVSKEYNVSILGYDEKEQWNARKQIQKNDKVTQKQWELDA